MSTLNEEQVEKLKRTWLMERNFNLCDVPGSEPWHAHLDEWQKAQRRAVDAEQAALLHDSVVAAHRPEVVWIQESSGGRETMKRTKTPGGYIYNHTVVLLSGGALPLLVSDSMCFVPNAEEYFLGAPELSHILGTTEDELKKLLHKSRDLPDFISKFDFKNTPDPELYLRSLREVWRRHWS